MKQFKKEPERMSLINNEHRIYLDGVTNARELAGYMNQKGKKLQNGRIIRSGELCSATPDDLKKLAEIYHVGTVIDLRPKEMVTNRPDEKIPGARYINIPLLRSWYLAESAASMYSEIMFGELAKKSFSLFFEILSSADDKHSVLFHDTSGINETGIASALLLSLLGFSYDFIIEEYTLSGKTVISDSTDLTTERRLSIHTYALEYVLSRARVEYGSVNEYINKQIRISKDTVSKLIHSYMA